MRSFVLERISEPDDELLTLEELKRHLRMYSSNDEEDDDLNDLMRSARHWIEQTTLRSPMQSQWRMIIGDYHNIYRNVDSDTVSGAYTPARDLSSPDGSIMLLPSPVMSISAFINVASDGSETTIDDSTYELRKGNSRWPELVPLTGAGWSTGEFKIEMRCGWLDVDDVPTEYKQAAKLWCEAHYDRDKDMMDLLMKSAMAVIEPQSANLNLA